MVSHLGQDKLYRHAVIWTIIFAVVSCAVMVIFKMNEAYFDSYSVVLLQEDNAPQEQTSVARYNMKVELEDKAQSELILPLTQKLSADHVTVREDFVEEKLVVTMKGAASCLESGSLVTIDSNILDAVGVYRQQEDIVLEMYCKDAYGYELSLEENQLVVSFAPLRSQYQIVSVIYVPLKDRERLVNQDMQELDKIAGAYGMKVYKTWQMQTEYSQQQVVDFANQIHADMLLGIGVEEGAGQDRIETLCNAGYFIPDFGGVDLAAVMTDSMNRVYSALEIQVMDAGEEYTLIHDASVPAAMTFYYTKQAATGRPETEYDTNRKLINALTDMYKQVLSTYFTSE